MRVVPVLARTTLGARALFVRGHADGWAVVAPDGAVTLLDVNLQERGRWLGGRRLVDVAVMSDHARLVVADDATLACRDLATGAAVWQVPGTFVACRLGRAGLWAAEHQGDRVAVTLRDVTTGAVLRDVTVPDPFGGATAMLLPHPDPDAVVVWVAAGQDGQASFLVRDEGRFVSAIEVGGRDRLPPVFTPAGDSFLSAGAAVLELRAWPADQLIDALPWSDDEDPVDPEGDELAYLPGGFAAWASAEGRLYVVDLHELAVVDEVFVDGYPPGASGTSFTYAEPGPGGLVVTVHGDTHTELAVTALAAWSPDSER
ncbi:MAG: hypothetical protein R3B06_18865 [Kofleriaceae bacterium]